MLPLATMKTVTIIAIANVIGRGSGDSLRCSLEGQHPEEVRLATNKRFDFMCRCTMELRVRHYLVNDVCGQAECAHSAFMSDIVLL